MNTPRIWIITVHPRGHGEHRKGSFSKRTLFGSSPWARGTHSWTGGRLSNSRFIPVGTGNTLLIESKSLCNPVHPRGHGEHGFVCGMVMTLHGSSPWARGTLVLYILI